MKRAILRIASEVLFAAAPILEESGVEVIHSLGAEEGAVLLWVQGEALPAACRARPGFEPRTVLPLARVREDGLARPITEFMGFAVVGDAEVIDYGKPLGGA